MPAALSGARLSLVAPALALTASGLLTAAAVEAGRYLAAGRLQDFPLSVLLLVAALVAMTGCALMVSGPGLVLGLLAALPETLAQGLLAATVALDVYGLERRVLGARSHFGTVSWLLNVFVVVVVVFVIVRSRRTQTEGGETREVLDDRARRLLTDWTVDDGAAERTVIGPAAVPGATMLAPVTGIVSVVRVSSGGLRAHVYPYVVLQEPVDGGRQITFRPGRLGRDVDVWVGDGQEVIRGSELFTVRSYGLSSWARFFDPSFPCQVTVTESGGSRIGADNASDYLAPGVSMRESRRYGRAGRGERSVSWAPGSC